MDFVKKQPTLSNGSTKSFDVGPRLLEIVAGELACYRILAYISLKNGNALEVKPC